MTDVNQSLLLRALRREPTSRTPVWIMRQAGRYLPEYQAVRRRAGDFLSLCKNPEFACEVALQPLRRFALDAAILFSDILTIPDAMGLGLSFKEGEGPCFAKPLRSVAAIEDLEIPDVADTLSYVMDAVRLIRREMPSELPLIGFAGSPWTLACYMVEGSGSKDFKQLLQLVYTEQKATHLLLNKLTVAVTNYLLEQIKAGANVLMLFDTWGGMLPPGEYLAFSLHYMQEIVRKIKIQYPHIPIILFTKGGGLWLEAMVATGCDALGLDWTCDLGQARQRVHGKVALQGNLHPGVLLTNKTVIREQVQRVLHAFGRGPGHVFNLGHGITPDVPPDHVAVMVDAVHEFSESNSLEQGYDNNE